MGARVSPGQTERRKEVFRELRLPQAFIAETPEHAGELKEQRVASAAPCG